MSAKLYLPTDAFSDQKNDPDLAADYLELKAFFSSERQAFTQDVTDALELAAEEDYDTVEQELETRGEAATVAVARIVERTRVLGDAYPFSIDDSGDVLTFKDGDISVGQASYLLSLVLSHLKSVSEVLRDPSLQPTEPETVLLRNYFQYFATAALAAEIGGPAWSFGHPRPNGTGFFVKLREIWSVFRDGTVNPDPSAPDKPKDDQVDVFAWRQQRDGLPGFLLAVAQVATGKGWKGKSVKAQAAGIFQSRWFQPPPVTVFVPYHIIPFARPDRDFRDDVRVLGNVLHRIRVPYRVSEAENLVANGINVEAFDQLPGVIAWLREYQQRGVAA